MSSSLRSLCASKGPYRREQRIQLRLDLRDRDGYELRQRDDGVGPGLAGLGVVGLDGVVNELAEAADERTLSRVISRYGLLELLCLDELAYLHLDPRGAELLFQVLTEREERASVAVASNAPFSEWGQTFADSRLAAAVVDRLTFKAHIIETGSESYRLRLSRAGRRCWFH